MGITEGWLDNNGVSRLAQMTGLRGSYEVLSCPSRSKGCQKGKGAILLVKRSIYAHCQDTWSIPGRAIAIRLRFRGFALALVCLYAPTDPDSAGVEETSSIASSLKSYLHDTQRKGYSVIVMGDLNCCLSDIDREGPRRSNPSEIAKILLEKGLIDIWRAKNPNEKTYSHQAITPEGLSRARLDYFLITADLEDYVLDTGIGEDDQAIGTNHFPIFLNLIRQGTLEQRRNVETPARRVINIPEVQDEQWATYQMGTAQVSQELEADLRNLEQFPTQERMDETWTKLNQQILDLAHSTLPIKIIRPRTRVSLEPINWIAKNAHELARYLNPERPNIIKATHRLKRLKQILGNDLTISLNSSWSAIQTFAREAKKSAQTYHELKSQSKTREAIQNRCQQLQNAQGLLIKRVLERTQLNCTIDMVKEGDHVFTEPTDVKQKTVDYFAEWFGRRRNNLDGSEWEPDYEPVASIQPQIYDNLKNPISFPELQQALNNSGSGKAPGPNGIPIELYKKASPSFLLTVLRLMVVTLSTLLIPQCWTATNIFCIAKKTNYAGDLNGVRPITLINVERKIFSKIMTARLAECLEKNKILCPTNFAGPGKQALDSVHILQTCVEDAHLSNKDLLVASLDIRRAFDSVPFDSLERSLQRLKIPTDFTALLMGISTSRQVQVITKYGLTPAFQPLCGIEQGEINAPLLWRIFYDPLLTRLNKSINGYMLERPVLPNLIIANSNSKLMATSTHDPLPKPSSIKVNNLAFMDDLALIAEKTGQLISLLNTVSNFMDVHTISLNASKTVLARKISEPQTPPAIAGELIGCVLDDGESFRFLGVDISLQPGRGETKSKLHYQTQQLAQIMADKKITDKIIGYIYTSVILPQLSYKASGLCLTMEEAERIEKPIRAVLKNKCGLPKSISNSVLYSPAGYNLQKLLDSVDQAEITNWLVWLNSPDLVGNVTRCFFAKIQQHSKQPIFPASKPQGFPKKLRKISSKYLHLLNRLDTRNIQIGNTSGDYSVVKSLSLAENDHLIQDIIPTELWEKSKEGLWKNRTFLLSQLRSPTPIYQGRKPKWLAQILEILTDDLGRIKPDFRGPSTTVKTGQVPRLTTPLSAAHKLPKSRGISRCLPTDLLAAIVKSEVALQSLTEPRSKPQFAVITQCLQQQWN